MSPLLEDLKQEHRILLGILEEVKKLGISSPPGQQRLLSARAILLSHMQKEDREFYPSLRRAAENSDDLRKVLAYFARDMEVVSRKAFSLFDRHAQGSPQEDVAGELTLLYMTLKDRIRTEEDVLFKKYEQVSAQQE
jgi:iron-sulfur cluster repair protein YtfE (RIC family)